MLLTPAQIKPKSLESGRNSFFFIFFFLPGVDVLHVYESVWALGCFYSHISTQTFRRTLTASVDSCAEIKSVCRFSGVTRSGRVWKEGAGKRCSECAFIQHSGQHDQARSHYARTESEERVLVLNAIQAP